LQRKEIFGLLAAAMTVILAPWAIIMGSRERSIEREVLPLIFISIPRCDALVHLEASGGTDIFDEEKVAIERSLDLQRRLLDRAELPFWPRSAGYDSVYRLFALESTLCGLVLHPHGSLWA